MTELDTAHVGKPITTPKDSLMLSSTNMMEKQHGIYVVKLGETPSGISRRIGISISELRKKNNSRLNVIYVGQELKY